MIAEAGGETKKGHPKAPFLKLYRYRTLRQGIHELVKP